MDEQSPAPDRRPVVPSRELSLAEQRAAWRETWALLFRRRAERLAKLAASGGGERSELSGGPGED